jgi:hypothetical protein
MGPIYTTNMGDINVDALSALKVFIEMTRAFYLR